MDYLERRNPKEYAYPVTIGEDCWIGGGAVICPGGTIGDRCVIRGRLWRVDRKGTKEKER